MKKILSLLIIGLLILGGIGAIAITDNKTSNIIKVKEESIIISEPIIKDKGQYVTVSLEEATTSLLKTGKPILPVVSRVFTFPFGTKVNSVDVSISQVNELILSKEVQPAPEPVLMNDGTQVLKETIKDSAVYKSADLYPTSDYIYITASGLDQNKHVVYLVVQWYPVRYSPTQNVIYYSNNADIKITYEEPTSQMSFDDVYDMVIIAPLEFSNELQPLIDHKNSYGVDTILKTTETIYSEYDGYDQAEEIKYFIKNAIESWGIDYVLLVGSIDKLPIRTTYASPWGEDLLCDLYYADIYNSTGGFCSWDGNSNGRYGEVYQDHHQTYDIDGVDLFPDVNIGRLACVDKNEVSIVADKIINYETSTNGKSWFNNIVYCGGDTFPGHNGNEGEEINQIIEQIMTGFVPTELWTSTNTFNFWKLNQAVNNGAGFVDYSGHGFADGLGTHPPNSNSWKMYYSYNLVGLSNINKLPIVFFDACLTAKLDYYDPNTNVYHSKPISQVLNSFLGKYLYKPVSRILNLFLDDYNTKSVSGILDSDVVLSEPSDRASLTPCFAWNWVKKSNGGAIATIGATRTAYGGIDSGVGKLSIEFFSAYKNSETLGQMMTQAQNGYITDVPNDFFTVEEFVLIGDPSLKIGGYPATTINLK